MKCYTNIYDIVNYTYIRMAMFRDGLRSVMHFLTNQRDQIRSLRGGMNDLKSEKHVASVIFARSDCFPIT